MATVNEMADQAAKVMKDRNASALQAVALVCKGKDERTFRHVCSILGRRAAAHRIAIKHHSPSTVSGSSSPVVPWYQQGQYA